jgi:hypothetical protein
MAADPTSTAQAFKAFDTNLNLDPAERTEAQDLHNDITDLLKRNNIAVAGFLQGSFARKTMLRPLHDVDKVVILYEDLTGIGPEEMMDKLESVIAEEYPSATFERSRHALKITLPDHDFHFDTVPAWETAGETDDILIANRDSGGWDVSNTRELIRPAGGSSTRCAWPSTPSPGSPATTSPVSMSSRGRSRPSPTRSTTRRPSRPPWGWPLTGSEARTTSRPASTASRTVSGRRG